MEIIPFEKKKKIVFFFRKGVVAKGDFALYYCIAAKVAVNGGYEVYCVNNSNKEIQAKYLDSGIHFCDINKDTITQFRGATFVTAFNQLFFMLEELEGLDSAKVLLLFLHPNIYTWMMNQLSSIPKINSLFKLLKEKNAYAFMDKGNLLAIQKHAKVKFEPRYFPVVTDVQYKDAYVKKRDDRFINIVWFGRLDGDKIYSLINFLDNIVDFDFGKPLSIHLVGDGESKDLIRFNKYAPQMRFIFNSFLYGEEKNRYLKENADMVVAMGISALDAALLRIPTILPIVSAQPFKDNKFALFSDTKEYCLGVAADDIKSTHIKTFPAHKIVELCYKNREVIGQKCYDYAVDNFYIDNQIDAILEKINSTNLTLKSCRKNRVVFFQQAKFKLYRAIRGNRSYKDYLLFWNKVTRYKEKSLKQRIICVLKKIRKDVKNG